MAVLTALRDDEARELAIAYGLGTLRNALGIAGGSVNSNFALDLETGRVFLRIYEERDVEGAGRETAMLSRLARAGVPTPEPLRRRDGALVSVVQAKPAALFPWCEGSIRCQASVRPADAWRVGEALARVHLSASSEACDPGRFQYQDLVGRLDHIAAADDPRFAPFVPSLRASLERIHAARDPDLPAGLVHGDLFRDNVLWSANGRIAALLDFESACRGTYAYDLMVTVLSWSFGADLDAGLASSICRGYESIRPFSNAEKAGLFSEGRFAAVRFTITRITDYAMRSDAAGPRVVKDWRRFMTRLERLEVLGHRGLRDALGL